MVNQPGYFTSTNISPIKRLGPQRLGGGQNRAGLTRASGMGLEKGKILLGWKQLLEWALFGMMVRFLYIDTIGIGYFETICTFIAIPLSHSRPLASIFWDPKPQASETEGTAGGARRQPLTDTSGGGVERLNISRRNTSFEKGLQLWILV